MRILLSLLTVGLLLAIAGCKTSSTAVASSSSPPVPAAVGPIPGPPAPPNERTNPLNGDPVALQDGRRLFDWYNCSGCHGGHAGGGMGPSLRDPVWLYGDRDEQIFDSIAEGRSKGMPAWGSRIPEHQIWELVAYIKSMGTPQEPDPPVEPADEEVPNPEHNTIPASRPKPQ
ncbi:MAG: c-type cytochrome [Acidobacteriaceae bacterium]|nr:c-type cytochrome [Acidobacteriaceae bacterium]